MKLTLLALLFSASACAQSTDSLYGWKRTPEGYIMNQYDTLRATVLVSKPGYAAIEIDGYVVMEDEQPISVIKLVTKRRRIKLVPMRSWTTIWAYKLAEEDGFHTPVKSY